MNPLLTCPWEDATHLGLFSSNVPPILYYSHVPAMLVAILFAFFVFFHTKKSLVSYSLISIAVFFSFWNLADLILWATNKPEIVMFFWSLQILFEALIFISALYLVHAFVKKTGPKLLGTSLLTVLLLPLVALIPSKFNLVGVYLADCVAIENLIAKYYSYGLEAVIIIVIAIFTFRQAKQKKLKEEKREIVGIGIGIIVFLAMFVYGNLIGSFLGNWELAQYGLFGMPIFVALLSYLIVKYKSFDVKVFGTQILVTALWIVVAAVLFIRTIESVRLIILLTLILVFFSGLLLIRSVRREIEQRERLEEVTKALGDANVKLKKADQLKSEFLSFASHDLKSPVAKMKQWAALVRDGTITDKDKILETVTKIEHTGDNALRLVEEFLNIRKIEEGQMEYNLEEVDFIDFVKKTKESFGPIAKEKGLELSFETSAKNLKLKIDLIKMRQVIENLIENSLKYTEKGSIKISLDEEEKSVLITIKDTGLGISKDILQTLFEQFHRASGEAKKIVGTGLGLYIAKQIVKAHHGDVWAESDGEGKGSRFYVRLPK